MENVSLQIIIDTISFMLELSIPIALFFGFTTKIVNFFFSMAFGEKRIKL